MTLKKKNNNSEKKNIKLAINSLKKAIILLNNLKPKKTKTIKKEIKINLDQKLNKIICENLKASGIPIISEENPQKKNNFLIKSKNSFWVVDPLDGSLNHLKKIPYSSICISLVSELKLSFSLIYDIYNKDLYMAYKKNIFLNNKKISFKRKNIKKKNSILVTGFPHKYNFSLNQINFRNFQKVRMIGCASLSLLGCMIGKFDWYHEKNIMIWDVIAGYHFNLINKCKVDKFNLTKLCQEVSLGYCK